MKFNRLEDGHGLENSQEAITQAIETLIGFGDLLQSDYERPNILSKIEKGINNSDSQEIKDTYTGKPGEFIKAYEDGEIEGGESLVEAALFEHRKDRQELEQLLGKFGVKSKYLDNVLPPNLQGFILDPEHDYNDEGVNYVKLYMGLVAHLSSLEEREIDGEENKESYYRKANTAAYLLHDTLRETWKNIEKKGFSFEETENLNEFLNFVKQVKMIEKLLLVEQKKEGVSSDEINDALDKIEEIASLIKPKDEMKTHALLRKHHIDDGSFKLSSYIRFGDDEQNVESRIEDIFNKIEDASKACTTKESMALLIKELSILHSRKENHIMVLNFDQTQEVPEPLSKKQKVAYVNKFYNQLSGKIKELKDLIDYK